MKKILIFPMILAWSFLILACGPETRLSLDSDTTVATTIEILSGNLESMLENDESFALLIGSDLCSSCQEFHPFLDQVITEYQIRVYEIIQEDGFLPENSLIPYSNTPSFVIVRNGVVEEIIDPVTHDQAFESAADFAEYIDNFIILEKK